MKRTTKKYIIIIALMLLFINITYSVQAVNFGDADNFITVGSSEENRQISDLGAIGTEFSTIGSILTYIGAGILVGATAYMGILYIISPPEKQAKLKQQLIGLVVAAIVIFGAYGIWEMVVNLLDSTIG